METKLTLRLDDALIAQAKAEASHRGTSVSKMVAGYFQSLTSRSRQTSPESLPPMTSSLLGSLRGSKADQGDYRKHLEEKYR